MQILGLIYIHSQKSTNAPGSMYNYLLVYDCMCEFKFGVCWMYAHLYVCYYNGHSCLSWLRTWMRVLLRIGLWYASVIWILHDGSHLRWETFSIFVVNNEKKQRKRKERESERKRMEKNDSRSLSSILDVVYGAGEDNNNEYRNLNAQYKIWMLNLKPKTISDMISFEKN